MSIHAIQTVRTQLSLNDQGGGVPGPIVACLFLAIGEWTPSACSPAWGDFLLLLSRKAEL